MDYNAQYRGFKHNHIYKNIHHIIKDLIDAGIFESDSYLGRLPFAGIKSFTRAALKVSVGRLLQMRNRIDSYAMTHDYDHDELFSILVAASFNAATNDLLEMRSEVCSHAFTVLRALPERTRKGVLMGRFESVNLFTATYKQMKGGK